MSTLERNSVDRNSSAIDVVVWTSNIRGNLKIFLPARLTCPVQADVAMMHRAVCCVGSGADTGSIQGFNAGVSPSYNVRSSRVA